MISIVKYNPNSFILSLKHLHILSVWATQIQSHPKFHLLRILVMNSCTSQLFYHWASQDDCTLLAISPCNDSQWDCKSMWVASFWIICELAADDVSTSHAQWTAATDHLWMLSACMVRSCARSCNNSWQFFLVQWAGEHFIFWEENLGLTPIYIELRCY